MWLSEKSAKAGMEAESCADIGQVTIGGEEAAVDTGGECRDAVIAAPGGYVWLPEKGQEALLINCGDGSKAVAGQVGADIPAGMAAGEVYIRSKGAEIYIKNDGTICISGRVAITGSLTVNGRAI